MDVVPADKMFAKMRKHQSGWRLEQLQAVAEGNSIEWRRPGRGGSYVIFSAAGVRDIVSVPSRRPIKPIYSRQFVSLVDAARALKKESE
jgi:hypothetical protein